MNFVHCSFYSYIVRSEQWIRLSSSLKLDMHVYIITSMALDEVNTKNSNASGSDEILGSNSVVTLNYMVLLVRIEHANGQPIEPEILTETSFTELCTYTNPAHTPYAVEILSSHRICLTYKQGITLGHVAGELMVIESWMDFPILVMVVIIK